MTNQNYSDKMMMPEFAIDTTVDANQNEIPGIKRMFDIGLALKDSMMLWGPMGVGKSEGIRQWNKEKVEEYQARIAKGEDVKPWNPVICDVRLSMKEPVDMQGIPVPTKNGNETQTVWAIPSMWPRETGEFSGGVILLDEMNQGQPAILNAAFQLIQDRALGDYKVPDGYMIIAASNPSAYNSSVSEFSLPLSNRFSHFNIKPDFESWMNYRLNNGGNADVMAFLKTQGMGLLFDKQGIESKVGSLDEALFTDVVVTPRSWEVIEKLLALPEGTKATGGFSIEEKQRYATGRLGLSLTSKLFNYLKDKTKYQDWQEILVEGKNFRSEDTEQFWSVQIACMSAINSEHDDKKCREYILNLIKAIRNMKSTVYKVHTISQLVRSKRVFGRMDIFCPMTDAQDLIALSAKVML